MINEITHPYLKACLAFLCNDSKSFKSVLEESNLSLTDRVGFACRFLEDIEVRVQVILESILIIFYVVNAFY
jgi:hypothetical protein